jgi:hypothetical protein
VTCDLLVSSGSVAAIHRRKPDTDTVSPCSSRSRWWIVETVTVPGRLLM